MGAPGPRTRKQPRQSIASLTVNIERCFKRVEDMESISHSLRSMVESTNRLVLDLDKKVAEAMNLASGAYAEKRAAVVNVAARAYDDRRFDPLANRTSSPTPETKTFAVRFNTASGDKVKTVEAYSWDQRNGIVEFYRGGIVLAVACGRFISAEVID